VRYEIDVKGIMSNDAVVIIGAGPAGLQLAASLRSGGHTGSIDLVGAESHLPYQRPPLSKEYLAGTMSADGLHLRREAFFADKGIQLHRGDAAVAVDRTRTSVRLASGAILRYDRLVFATGARPRELPLPGRDLPGVVSLREIGDADKIVGLLAAPRRIVIIGGGFIGLELAAVTRAGGHAVTVIEGLDRPLARAVSPELSSYLETVHARHGTDLLLGRTVSALHGRFGKLAEAELDNGIRMPADVVVVGVGAIPNVELATEAGLPVANGIVVDERLSTSDERISAIGDCACFPNSHARNRIVRLESVQNAVDQAKFVADRLLGIARPRYDRVPWFWSHQFDVKIQTAGLPAVNDRRVTLGDPRTGSFSILRFDDGELSCVESVGNPADHMAARKILGSRVRPTLDVASQHGFTLKAFPIRRAQASAA
jgi:3-phenylpropionate/trans-cinnamate dioxygenase ferredoxin reductase subunit